jgi:arylformamidase
MKPFQKIYDLTVPLKSGVINYPGDPPFKMQSLAAITDDNPYELNAMSMSMHAGTHIDFPAHFIRNGKRNADFSAEQFILTAVVADFPDTQTIHRDLLEKLTLQPGTALLLKTQNSYRNLLSSGEYVDDYVYLTDDAADYCVEKKLKLVGIDYLSVENPRSESFTVHRKLLAKEILILENIHLRDVPSGTYTLIALPLSVPEAEATPVRAVLTL